MLKTVIAITFAAFAHSVKLETEQIVVGSGIAYPSVVGTAVGLPAVGAVGLPVGIGAVGFPAVGYPTVVGGGLVGLGSTYYASGFGSTIIY